MKSESGYFLNSGVLYIMAKRAYERIKSAPSETTPNQDDALTALLFSAATLEAFIAELAYHADVTIKAFPPAPSTITALAHVLDEIESSRGSIRLKFLMAKVILSGESYHKGSKPFQNFELLFTIRDAIVHHKPEKITQKPHKIVAALAAKGLCEREDPHRKRSWLQQITTRAVARWACNVVRDMVASIGENFPDGADTTPNSYIIMAHSIKSFDGVK